MLYLETLIKQTAADPDLIEVHWHCCLMDNYQCQSSDGKNRDWPTAGKNRGGRLHYSPQKPALCGTKRFILSSSRHQQTVQQRNHLRRLSMRAEVERRAKIFSACLYADASIVHYVP